MLKVFLCIAGVLLILLIAEMLRSQKILHGELVRKFTHIGAGCFIAFWPWFISWKAIAIVATGFLAGVLINQKYKIFHYNEDINRDTYGDSTFTIAILACALLTDVKIFFAIAILHLALADGLAAVVGKTIGKRWQYKIFAHTKTVIGSMVFWIISIFIFGIALLFANDLLSYKDYAVLILAAPPILTILESVCGLGLDNIVVPIAVLVALQYL